MTYHELAMIAGRSGRGSVAEISSAAAEYEATPNGRSRTLYYVSDLHLDHKRGFQTDKRGIIGDAAHRLMASQRQMESDAICLFAGDTADSVEDCCLFYGRMRKALGDRMAVAVLGNHELKNRGGRAKTYRGVVAEYRRRLERYRITLLNDDLLIIGRGYAIKDKVWLLQASVEQIREELWNSEFAVFGSTGFVKANAEDEMLTNYENTISRDEEINLWADFRAIYDKLRAAARGKRVIVMTHMPAQHWGDGKLEPGWVYVGGHTHRNQSISRDGSIALYDNQVGYTKMAMSLNRLRIHFWGCDLDFLPDGIHRIDRNDYIEFNRGRGVTTAFNGDGQIIMVKREGWSIFLLDRGGRLLVMDGGHVRKATHDSQHYYDNLPAYGRGVQAIMGPFMDYILEVSNRVKQIGGTGTIHGCIVDIDYSNHIYVNPLDGSLVPYWAEDMVIKRAYRSVESLLEHEKPWMLRAHPMLPDVLSLKCANLPVDRDYMYVPETFMYSISNRIRRFQNCCDLKVVREWDDKIIDAEADGRKRILESSVELHPGPAYAALVDAQTEAGGEIRMSIANGAVSAPSTLEKLRELHGKGKYRILDELIVLRMDICLRLGTKPYSSDDPEIRAFHEYCKARSLISYDDVGKTCAELVETKIQMLKRAPRFIATAERPVMTIYYDYYKEEMMEASIRKDAEAIRMTLDAPKASSPAKSHHRRKRPADIEGMDRRYPNRRSLMAIEAAEEFRKGERALELLVLPGASAVFERKIVQTSQFENDLGAFKRSPAELLLLSEAISILGNGGALPLSYGDHALKGDMEGMRLCRIGSSRFLVYLAEPEGPVLIAVRAGYRHDIFTFR